MEEEEKKEKKEPTDEWWKMEGFVDYFLIIKQEKIGCY
jgi:hypothetical protein